MSWSSKYPQLFHAFQLFILECSQRPGPLHVFLDSESCTRYLAQFPEAQRTQQQASLTLLAGALHQGISVARLFDYMQVLLTTYGDRVFTVPALTQKELFNTTRDFCKDAYWSIQDQIPGIIWSVGEFVRSHNLPSLMVEKSYPDVVALLAKDIFYMGATSEHKYKAKRSFNWLALPYPVGMGLKPEIDGDELIISVDAVAHRFMRDVGPLYESTKKFPTKEHRIGYYKSFYGFLSPGFPQLIEHVFYFLDTEKMAEFKQLQMGETHGSI